MRLRLGLAIALAASGGTAQEPGAVRESVDVSLVEVPVRVLDRAGQPVRGLTRDDFTLTDQGRPQTILGFDAIDLGEPAEPGRGTLVAPAARRRFLLLFDFSFARPTTIVAARRAARTFVLEAMQDGDLAAVATHSVERGVRLLLTFSGDRAELARAIDLLGVEPGRKHRDPLQFAYDTVRRVPASGDAGGTGNRDEARAGPGGPREGQAFLNDWLRTVSSLRQARDDDYERGRVRALLQSLRELARTLNAVEGRKEIIFLSEGFHSRFLVGTLDTAEEQTWLLQGDAWKVDADKRFGNVALRNDLAEMADHLRRTDCLIHTVDIAGIATKADAEGVADSGSPYPRFTQNALFELAEHTGGESLRNANDFGPQLAALTRRTSLVYVLAFRPDRTEGEGKYHALKVKVSAPGARAVARVGYFERRDFRQRTALERALSAADIIVNEIPAGDVPARVLAAPFPASAAGDPALISVLVEVPGGPFLADEKGDHTAIEIFAYAFDGTDRLGDYFAQSIALDVVRGRDTLEAGGLRYFGQLRLPPGDFRLRTLVRNANTGRAGLAVTSVRVPAFTPDAPYLLPPIFLDSVSPDWATLRGRDDADAGNPGGRPAPFGGLAGERYVPAAAPRIVPGGSARLCVVSYHLGAEVDTYKIAGQVLGADGRYLSAGTLTLLGKVAPDADGRRVFLLSFTAPDLPPGRYGLRILVEATAAGLARQSSASFVIP